MHRTALRPAADKCRASQRVGSSSTSFAAPPQRPHPRSVVARAETPHTSDRNLAALHEELLKEIEERRKSQARLLAKLSKLAEQSSSIQVVPEIYVEPEVPVPVPEPVYIPQPVQLPQPPRQYAPQFQQPPLPLMQPAMQQQQFEEAQVIEEPPQEVFKELLAGPNVMNVVMVGAECAPWSKTGGLGDVMAALPKALRRRGHRVMVIAPRYAIYPDAWETGVRRQFNMFGGTHEVGYFHAYIDEVDYVFVDHPCFQAGGKDIYSGGRLDLLFRCSLLCKAALEAVWCVPCGGITYGDDNLCYIANDWHTALLPVYLQAHYRDYGQMTYARCLFVIHNMAHQGRGPFDEMSNLELSTEYKEKFRLDDPIGGEHMNIMKAGLMAAHRLVAVSHGYAWECQTPEGGWGLHELLKDSAWKLRGIVNGIDCQEWDPVNDAFLQDEGYVNYSIDTLEAGKRACKVALQKELGLPQNPDIPMLGFIGRLDYQKGVDLIRDCYDWLMGERVQLVLLGSGREDLETALRDMEGRNKTQCRAWVGFSVKMAHRITAGCDLLLMPSRFEPCGLNQLYAMAYGTVPVVHAVGGLRDTVKPYNPFENSGTGWCFDRAEANKLREAMGNALTTYRQHRKSFVALQKRGMEQDLSWDNAASQYEEVLVAAKYQW